MKSSIDISGQRFGRLTAIKPIGTNKNRNMIWFCRCDCGNEATALCNSLRSGNTKSCGCLHKEKFSNEKHGKHNTRLYRIWRHMLDRCNNESDVKYAVYGGRGISVCAEWENSFESFYNWAMANGYADNLTIDRRNNNGNYCPENCRWATSKQQNTNRRNCRYITYNGVTLTEKEWANRKGIKYTTLYQRLHTRHWSIERALETP